MEKINKLKDVTKRTFKRLKHCEVVMPSDYLDSFKQELGCLDCDSLDVEEMIKEEVAHDLSISMNIIKETGQILTETGNLINKTADGIEKGDSTCLMLAKKEIDKLLSKVNEMSKEIYNDELTGVYNRKWFFKEYLIDEKYPKENGVIAFLDLNKLKEINDTHGHKIGDKAIIYFATFIKDNLSASHVIRFAGDEFIVLFENSDLKNVENTLKSAVESLNKKTLTTKIKNKEIFLKLSFSFGAAEYFKEEDIVESIDKADHIMYVMKNLRKGNNSK